MITRNVNCERTPPPAGVVQRAEPRLWTRLRPGVLCLTLPAALVLCRLEAEVREAQLRAKQEMLQGIQVAKEVAEQELCCQRAAFQGRIEALQAELVRAGRPPLPAPASFPGRCARWTGGCRDQTGARWARCWLWPAPCWAPPGAPLATADLNPAVRSTQ